MSRITRAIAQPLHAAKPDTRRRRPVRARTATTYGKYDTRFTYSSGYQANTVAARNQMLAKLKPRAKTAAASSRRRRRVDSQAEAFDAGEEPTMPHAHVTPHDERDQHGGGQGGGRQQRERALERGAIAPPIEPAEPARRIEPPLGAGRRVHARGRAFPQQRGGFFERCRHCERDRVAAAIPQRAVSDLRDARFEDGHAPIERALGDLARALRVRTTAREQANLVGVVMAALARAVGERAQQAAAHIRIEGRHADAEQLRSFVRAQAGHGGGSSVEGRTDDRGRACRVRAAAARRARRLAIGSECVCAPF